MAPKKKVHSISSNDYEANKEMSIPKRIADFLNYAAKNFPSDYAPYGMIAKAVLMLPRMPRADSKEAGMIQRNMARVRTFLREDYGRELDVQRSIGVRATVDSADTLQTSMPKRMRRLESARIAVVQTAGLIDVKDLPQHARDAPLEEVDEHRREGGHRAVGRPHLREAAPAAGPRHRVSSPDFSIRTRVRGVLDKRRPCGMVF